MGKGGGGNNAMLYYMMMMQQQEAERSRQEQAAAIERQTADAAAQREWQQQQTVGQRNYDRENEAYLYEQQLQREAAAKQRAEEERQLKIAQNQERNQGLYDSALGYSGQQFGARGYNQELLDKYGVGGLYNDAINQQYATWDKAADTNSFNTEQALANAVQTGTNTYRSDLRNIINQLAPESAGYDSFGDTADDSYIQAIIDQQYADAMTPVEAAYKRGQLNDAGYARAKSAIEQQRAAGTSDLQAQGLGVLTGYRNSLDTLRKNALDTASQADFGNVYDTGAFGQRWTDTLNSLMGSLEGDISRLGSQNQYFDPSKAIGLGGSQQGYYNPTIPGAQGGVGSSGSAENPLLAAFNDDEQKKAQQSNSSGVGNMGVF